MKIGECMKALSVEVTPAEIYELVMNRLKSIDPDVAKDFEKAYYDIVPIKSLSGDILNITVTLFV